MHLLKAIGIETAAKGFLIFLFYGILTTVYINIRHGLDAELPDSVVSTLSGPISIYTFGWLAIVGIIGLAASTKAGIIKCDFDIKRPITVFYFSLPICEAAIALGIVIGATLLGVALAAHLMHFTNFTTVSIHPAFYALSAFMFFITFPVAYFTITLLDHSRSMQRALNISAVLYLLITAIVFCVGLEINDVISISVIMSILITLNLILRIRKA